MRRVVYCSGVLAVIILIVTAGGCRQSSGIEPYRFDYFSSLQIPADIPESAADIVLTFAAGQQPPVYLNIGALEKFRAVTFESYDPWLEEDRSYTGVYLYELLAYYGFDEENSRRIHVVAENGIEASISIEDVKRYNYLLAYKENGIYYGEMDDPRENKGPCAIALDFDAHADMDIMIYRNHLIWWINEIRIE